MDKRVNKRCCWIFLLLINGLYTGQAKKKDIVINYTSGIEVCDDPESKSFLDMTNLKPVRINETTTKLAGSFSYKKGLKAPVKLQVAIGRTLPGGFKETIASYVIDDLCEEYERRNEDRPMSAYMRSTDVPNCPIPPGAYNVDNMFIDMSQVPKMFNIKGVYQITMTILSYEKAGKSLFANSKDTKLACLSFEITIE